MADEEAGVVEANKRNEVDRSEWAHEILKDELYLGRKDCAQSEEMLSELQITHIINCISTSCPEFFPEKYSDVFVKTTLKIFKPFSFPEPISAYLSMIAPTLI